jgi:hypothetical protein
MRVACYARVPFQKGGDVAGDIQFMCNHHDGKQGDNHLNGIPGGGAGTSPNIVDLVLPEASDQPTTAPLVAKSYPN